MKLLIEHRQGVKPSIEAVNDASPLQIMDAIGQLDGQFVSMIAIEAQDHRTMIGGGPSLFICSSENDKEIVNVLSDQSADDFIEVMVGGQHGDYPAAYVLDRKTAELIAAILIRGDALQQAPELRCEVLSK